MLLGFPIISIVKRYNWGVVRGGEIANENEKRPGLGDQVSRLMRLGDTVPPTIPGGFDPIC